MIRNVAGQIVRTIADEMAEQGDYSLNVDLSDLQSGIYFATLNLKYNGRDVVKTIRIVKGD